MSGARTKLSEEMLDESGEVTSSGRNVTRKGLQQFYTPEAFAKFCALVLCSDREAFTVADLTAGEGALLLPFQQADKLTFGVEIDKSRADKSLGVNRADLVKSFEFMRELRVQFHKVALNPPFGLEWEFGGKVFNSAELTIRMASELLVHGGEGFAILHESNWSAIAREIAEGRLDGVHPWAILRVKNLFLHENTDCESVVVFWSNLNHGRECFEFAGDFLNFGEWNLETLDELRARRRFWRALHPLYTFAELSRRVEAACAAGRELAKSGEQRFNLMLDGKQLRVHLSDFDVIKLESKRGEEFVRRVRRWSGLSVRYFSMNTHEARVIREAVSKELVTAESSVIESIAEAEARSAMYIAPFYPLKETQRLGYLKDLDKITCKASDPELEFVAGQVYTIKAEVIEWQGQDFKTKQRKEGESYREEVVELKTEGKNLRVNINGVNFDESPESISYIATHFEIPDPGDITDHKPSEYSHYLARLSRLESPRFQFKHFQKDDLARLCCRRGGVLAWEQGLRKMIGGLGWALAKDFKRVLIIAPQDLIPQWQAEARERFGVELKRINSPLEARELAKRVLHSGKRFNWKTGKRIKEKKNANTPPEFYIIHYEGLSRSGRVETQAEEVRWAIGSEMQASGSRRIKFASSSRCCPNCRREFAFNGRVCNPQIKRKLAGEEFRGCGYVHLEKRVHSASHWLKDAFSAVIVDEGTKMKGDSSLMGVAVRSLLPKGRLVLTGTPIKNFLPDAYWLLWWATGASQSESFPYGYDDKMKFLSDYCVIEYEAPCKRNGNRRGDRKVRPEISNLNMLWRVLNCNILRRRKSETGEELKRKKLIPVRVPFGREQMDVYRWWLFNFGDWYAGRPDTTINDPAFATALAGRLGQLWKLRQAASVPALAGLEEHSGLRGSTHATPKLLAALKLIREALESRESVVVFSTILECNRLIQDQLERAGIKSRIVDGSVRPEDRSAIVSQFKAGKFQVLLCGLEAMNLGHNIENSRRAVVLSLPFDLAGFDQAINRIHRLTSRNDVLVHVLLTEKSIDERMWELIERKGASAGLALDGALGFDEVELDLDQFARELRESFGEGGSTVPEEQIEAEIARVFKGLHLVHDDSGRQLGAASGLLDSIHFDFD